LLVAGRGDRKSTLRSTPIIMHLTIIRRGGPAICIDSYSQQQ
jgi:hypothetical protein